MSRIAVLYQKLPNPLLRHARRPWKEGGYIDSSADIAFALHACGLPLYLPARSAPRPEVAHDWAIADTRESLQLAASAGVHTVWANVPLHAAHPLAAIARDHALRVVGHLPAAAGLFDDKLVAARALRRAGVPAPAQLAVAVRDDVPGAAALWALSARALADAGLRGPPWVLKPVRGRGSQGVAVVRSRAELAARAELLLAEREADGEVARFGHKLVVEEFLPGDELTVAVLPPGAYGPPAPISRAHWALPVVRRAGHVDGVLPYSGVTRVGANSAVVGERDAKGLAEVARMCERTAEVCAARAVVRVDCRQDVDGKYRVFDVNMKPNMTAQGRPGREGQDSLVVMAARAFGWGYSDLLRNLMAQAWTPGEEEVFDLGEG